MIASLGTVAASSTRANKPVVVAGNDGANIFLTFENTAVNAGTDGGTATAVIGGGIVYDSVNKRIGSASLGLVNGGANSTFTIPCQLGSSGWTISVWVRWTVVSTNACVFYYTTGGSNVFYANWANTNNFQFTLGGANLNDTAANLGLNKTGSWNHIGWSVTSAGVSTICINGVQKATGMPTCNTMSSFATAPTNQNDVGVFILGHYASGQSMIQTGNLDNFRFYKTAFTLSQLVQLYTNVM